MASKARGCPCLLSALHPPSLVGGHRSPWSPPSLAAPTLSGPLPSSPPLRHLVSRQVPARLDTITGGGMTQDHVIIHFLKTRFLCTRRKDALQWEPSAGKPDVVAPYEGLEEASAALPGSLQPGPHSGNCLSDEEVTHACRWLCRRSLQQYPPHTHTHTVYTGHNSRNKSTHLDFQIMNGMWGLNSF